MAHARRPRPPYPRAPNWCSGPLFAANVQAAAGVTRAAGKPIIAFSTDASVAARSVYLLSFLPQTEVDRVVDEAVAARTTLLRRADSRE